MASSYGNDLRIEEQAVGENSGTWGTKVNASFSQIADGFSYGTKAMSSDANETFTMPDGTADATRSLYLKITSSATLTATRTITLGPNTVSKLWLVENATTGSQSIIIKQGSGATVTIASGGVRLIYTDGAGSGAAVVDAFTDLATSGTFTADGDVAIGSATANSNLDVTGSTGIYQRHSSGGSIVLDDSDTADGSSPMVYFRNTAGQLRLGGANRNATTKRTTGSVDYVTLDSGGMTLSTTINNTFSSTIPWNTYTGDTLVLKNLAGEGTDDYVAINMATSGAQTAAMRHILKAESNGDGNYYWQFRDTADVSNTTTRMQYTSDGDLTYYPVTATTTVFNSDAHDHDVQFKSDSLSHLLHVNGGANAVSVGGTGSDKRLNVYHTTNSTTGVHIENLDSGTSARASLALRSDGGFLYFFATSQAYSGVASWQDAAVIANSSSLAGGVVVNSQAGGITLQDSTVSRLEFVAQGELVINQSGIDRDFRVESDSDTHALFLEGSSGNVGIGTSSPAHLLSVDGAAKFGSVGPVEVGTNVLKASNTGSNGFLLRSAISSESNPSFSSVDDTNTGMFLPSGDVIGFSTAGSERVRVDSAGRVLIGTDTAVYAGMDLHIGNTSDSQNGVQIQTATDGNGYLMFGDGSSTDAFKGQVNYNHSNDYMRLVAGGSERARISADSFVVNEKSDDYDFRVETNTQTHMLYVDGDNNFVGFNASTATSNSGASFQYYTGGITLNVSHNSSAANGDKYIWFRRGGGTLGSITQVSDTGVAYNTTSDARMKENIIDADDAGKLLDQIKVRQFDWRETGEHQRFGMIAQELAEVVPEVVSVPSNPDDMQGIDYSRLMPLVIKEIQDLRARVQQLTRS